MEKWLTISLEKMKELYGKCASEEALQEYIICISRLLSGAAQMNHSYFYFYEKEILWNSLEVFQRQFVQQVERALTCDETMEKKAIIKDIENSLYEIANVYKNMIDSTANSDRQLFMSKAVNTNMYELSPKICAFYSGILAQIVKMFDADAKNYAFVLHPTFRNNIEACQLFRSRSATGKVVIIYIPENAIEQFDVLPIHLLHESFHVLTKAERLRKLRAKCYLQHMVLGIKQLLFKNVVFPDERNDEALKEKMLEYWLRDIRKLARKVNDMQEREFYSGPFADIVVNELRDILSKVDNKIAESVEICFCGHDISDFEQYEARRKNGIEVSGIIRKNLFEILCRDKLRLLSDMFFRVYREAYADIACILTLNIPPESYKMTFEKSIQFAVKDQFVDFEKLVRSMLVAKVVYQNIDVKYADKWQMYYEELKTSIKGENNEKKNQNSRQNGGECVSMKFSKQMEAVFFGYFNACAGNLVKKLSAISELDNFRGRIHFIMNSEQSIILPLIMSGKGFEFEVE